MSIEKASQKFHSSGEGINFSENGQQIFKPLPTSVIVQNLPAIITFNPPALLTNSKLDFERKSS